MSTLTLPNAPLGERLLTVADLAALPGTLPSGDVKFELHHGKLVVMAPPGFGHARRQSKIAHYLELLGEAAGHGESCGEVSVILKRNPDTVVAPDAAFILKASLPVRLSREGYLETIPELVVEIRSKNDFRPGISAKNEEYFDAGVELIWLIDQQARTVTAHRFGMPDQVFLETDTLTCHLIPEFAVPVAKLFAGS